MNDKQCRRPTLKKTRESRSPERIDLEKFKLIRTIVLEDQLKAVLGHAYDNGYVVDKLVRGWNDNLDHVSSPEGLRKVPDHELLNITGIGQKSLDSIRDPKHFPYIQPGTTSPTSERPTYADSEIGKLAREAREHGYHGVATLLTLAWVLDEQQKASQSLKPIPIDLSLIKKVQVAVVSVQLGQAGLTTSTKNLLLRAIRDSIVNPLSDVFDASDLSRISDDDLRSITPSKKSFDEVRSQYQYTGPVRRRPTS